MKTYAIIVAGGSGSRMGTELPKQFLEVNSKPVLMHTLLAFHRSSVKPEILLVLNKHYHNFWKELCALHQFDVPHILVEGGEERFHSVKNALNLVHQPSLVAIHDAVRPVISNELITRCFNEAEENLAVIPAVSSRDSLRQKQGNGTVALNRSEVLIVQTPQVFHSDILNKAYLQPYSDNFTDDASVVERNGNEIVITEGDSKNIKITYPEDLEIVALFLKSEA
ncbi:2-C-methyl-D-erythritol 4-phosphate cytidylyltransferase [Pedobacter sp. SYSU D00535]|uniref:2-C-methyl-D-erythritol 4-phosphate cytidylyltransferase n=1 Tax=Pedobacter sp. SYSU D00535 TaxID=2810308 RepID=UPI001A957695|nr:2-C-methyl-D-erythritol 4-phosphate cytidylyltransferase [Pedobacter sp. SYSU D00535]